MRLRHLIAAIVFGAPIVSSCDDIIISEDSEVRRVRIPATPDPDIAMLLETCKRDGNCLPLCDAVETGFVDRIENCHIETDALGDVVVYRAVTIYEDTCAGRRPSGYVARHAPARAARPLGALFAHQAALEAASVQAFDDLEHDLAALHAPRALQVAARRAARDEVRHARVCGRLATRYAGEWERPRAVPNPRRSAAALAYDNIVEGCVRETYGATIAAYQARTAGDHAIRSAMTAIARDEVKHAELAWRVQHWLAPRLSAAERQHARTLACGARDELFAQAQREPPPHVQTLAGVPSAAVATQLLAALAEDVWS